MIRWILNFIYGRSDMAYKATEIAWKILKEAKKKGVELSNLQLQKLVYIAHGYYMALYNKPLSEENFITWKYGPVSYSVYEEFKSYKGDIIPVDIDIATDLDNKEKEEFIIQGVVKMRELKGPGSN